MAVAVYKVEKRNEAQPVLFMVESAADDMSRRAAYQQLGLPLPGVENADVKGKLASVAQSLQDELDTVALVASAMLDSLRSASPSEVTLEFGVELGGKCGLPMLTEGSAKANLKVQLKWQAERPTAASIKV